MPASIDAAKVTTQAGSPKAKGVSGTTAYESMEGTSGKCIGSYTLAGRAPIGFAIIKLKVNVTRSNRIYTAIRKIRLRG